MFGLDHFLASFSDGTTLLLVIGVAILLGLRHATDPDHLAAVTTLIASSERRVRDAARLGLAWGAGHALTLFALGVPIVLYRAYLPGAVQRAAETGIGFLIAGLAVWLLVRWRRGAFHSHAHDHGDPSTPICTRTAPPPHEQPRSRTPLGRVRRRPPARHRRQRGRRHPAREHDRRTSRSRSPRSGILAAFTAVSMTLLTSGLGLTLCACDRSAASHQRSAWRASPSGCGTPSGAQNLLPYYF